MRTSPPSQVACGQASLISTTSSPRERSVDLMRLTSGCRDGAPIRVMRALFCMTMAVSSMNTLSGRSCLVLESSSLCSGRRRVGRMVRR